MSLNKRSLLVFAVVLWMLAGEAAAVFRDPLDIPASPSDLAQKSMLTGITQTPGGRWVAVGRRGHVLFSDDGLAWKQAPVPVSVDLVAVHFPTADEGWAVGHGGVILHSTDGGQTWDKQLDGRKVADLLVEHWKPLAAEAEEDDLSASMALMDAERFKEEGPGRPFLDVRFVDSSTGYAVGAYNLLLKTQDGGESWQVLADRTENPGALHFNAARLGEDGRVSLAGEQGMLLRTNPLTERFEVVETPYDGTWFGMLEQDDFMLLFGLRGNAYVSHDDGNSWSKVITGSDSTITAGTRLEDGRVVLVTQAGEALLSQDPKAERFNLVDVDRPMPLYGVASAGDSAIVAVGAGGVRRIELLPEADQKLN